MFIKMTISSNFTFSFTNFCVIVKFFLTKLLTLGISFSTAVTAVVVVAKLVILGILFLNSFILASREVVVAKLMILDILLLTSFILPLRVVLVAKLVISGILSSIFLILELYKSFLTLFFTTILSLLKSKGIGTNLSASNYLLYFSDCLNYLVHFFIYRYLIYLH